MNELDNPVLKDESAALLAAAEAADRGEPVPEVSVQPEAEPHAAAETEAAQPTGEQIKPDSSETKTEEEKPTDERPRDEHGKFVKKEEVKPEGEKPKETNYERAKKEAQRREVTWENINKRKSELDQKENEILAQSQQMAREREQLQQQMQQRHQGQNGKDDEVYTAQDYDNAAKDFERAAIEHRLQGDEAKAKELDVLAARSRDASKVIRIGEQRAQQEHAERQFVERYQTIARQEIATNPDLVKEGTPIYNEMARIMAEEPLLWRIPDGYAKAHRIAKLSLDAALVSELKEQNNKLKAEVEQLRKATQLEGSSPTSPSGKKSLEEMPLDEATDFLRRRAEEIDSTLVPA